MFKELVKWTDGDTGEVTNELLKGALVNFKRNADFESLKSSELYEEDELIATYDIEKGYKWIKPKFTISKELAALVEEKRGKYSLAQEVEERGEDRFKFFDVNKEMWDMFDQNPDWFEDRLVTTAGVYPYGNEKIGKVVDVLYHHGYAIEGEETEKEEMIILSTEPLIKLTKEIYDTIEEREGVVPFSMLDNEKESFRELWDIFDEFEDEINENPKRNRGKVEATAEWLYNEFIKEQPESVEVKFEPDNVIKCSFCGGINIQVKRVDGDLVTFLCNACTNAARGKEVTFVKEAHKGL